MQSHHIQSHKSTKQDRNSSNSPHLKEESPYFSHPKHETDGIGSNQRASPNNTTRQPNNQQPTTKPFIPKQVGVCNNNTRAFPKIRPTTMHRRGGSSPAAHQEARTTNTTRIVDKKQQQKEIVTLASNSLAHQPINSRSVNSRDRFAVRPERTCKDPQILGLERGGSNRCGEGGREGKGGEAFTSFLFPRVGREDEDASARGG
jgi:hypothetical protein